MATNNPKETHMTTDELRIAKPLIVANMAAGMPRATAIEEAAREVRMTTGPWTFGLSPEELAEGERVEQEGYESLARTAGVCEEFPRGEFPVPGFNC